MNKKDHEKEKEAHVTSFQTKLFSKFKKIHEIIPKGGGGW